MPRGPKETPPHPTLAAPPKAWRRDFRLGNRSGPASPTLTCGHVSVQPEGDFLGAGWRLVSLQRENHQGNVTAVVGALGRANCTAPWTPSVRTGQPWAWCLWAHGRHPGGDAGHGIRSEPPSRRESSALQSGKEAHSPGVSRSHTHQGRTLALGGSAHAPQRFPHRQIGGF